MGIEIDRLTEEQAKYLASWDEGTAPEEIVRLEDDAVVLLDQRRLPDEVVEVKCRSAAEVADAIRGMAIRGAPAIGVAAAYGLALAARRGEVDAAAATLLASRPTARNLAWALEEQLRARIERRAGAGAPRRGGRAVPAHERACRRAPRRRVLTHCNAGALATAGYGSAVGDPPRLRARPNPPRLGRRDEAYRVRG